MGLCKCPKRKVTNQFCFEHRVNVCEHCMVSNHPKCVVQSYCQWLKDSDYSALCALCQLDLSQNDCTRLICYHIFHLKCLDDHYKQFPSNTAPAGYTCPTCCSSLFPPSNLVSPVADVLRTVLTNRPWAREGLGLPLLPFDSTDNESSRGKVISSPLKEAPTNYSVVNVEADTPNTFHRNEPALSVKKTTPLLTDSMSDRDENKYKRRSPLASLKRTLSTILDTNARHRRGGKQMRRNVCISILALLAIIFFIGIGSRILSDPNDLGPSPLEGHLNHRDESS